MTQYKLDIFKMLEAVDCKDYDFYDRITDEERQGFSAFLALKWGASVEGSREIQHYYLAATNHYCNKYWYDITKHPKLQWLELCAAAPGVGKQRHTWLEMQKKDKTKNDQTKRLLELFPSLKISDVELLSKLITKDELDAYIKYHGE